MSDWKQDNKEILKRCTGLACDTPEATKKAAEAALRLFDGSKVFGGLSVKALHDAARTVLSETSGAVQQAVSDVTAAANSLVDAAQDSAADLAEASAKVVLRNIADVVRDIQKAADGEREELIAEAHVVFETLSKSQRASLEKMLDKANLRAVFDAIAKSTT